MTTNIQELLEFYKLSEDPCASKQRHGSKPCKFNPRCCQSLGGKKWTQDFKQTEASEVFLREPGTPVGLVNNGLLCYSNVLLQFWFQNKSFRQEVYNYDTEASGDSANVRLKIQLLQNVFAHMEFGNQIPYDPVDFVEGLLLNKAEQQDVNELYILLLHSLARVNQPFVVTTETTTRCLSCQNERSTSESNFLLSVISADKKDISLEDGLSHALKDEQMDGDSQYNCQPCAKKTDALRIHKITCFPKALVLQVIRFEFNKDIGKKRKLKFHLLIPDELNLTDESNQKTSYLLRAIVVHLGASCDRGHYKVFVKNRTKNQWLEFNDEKVSTLSLSNLRKKLVEGSQKKAPKTESNVLSSNNAYMLMYESSDQLTTETKLPEGLLTKITEENEQRALEYFNAESNQAEKMVQWEETAKYMQELLPQLSNIEPTSFDLVSLEWLKAWAVEPKTPGCIRHEELLCTHNKLQPQKYAEVRCIKSQIADGLYAKYKGGPRLQVPDALCSDCVTVLNNAKLQYKKIDVDFKQIKDVLKAFKPNSNQLDGYWVGKYSLNCWRKKAKTQVKNKLTDLLGVDAPEQESDDDEDKPDHKNRPPSRQKKRSASDMEDGDDGQPLLKNYKADAMNGELEKTRESTNKSPKSEDGSEQESEAKASTPTPNLENGDVMEGQVSELEAKHEKEFNEDLLCEHGELIEDVKQRKLVPEVVWIILKSYFPTALEYKLETQACPICSEEAIRTQQLKEGNLQEASKLRKELGFLVRNASNTQRFHKLQVRANRPPLMYLINVDFVKSINLFFKNSQLYTKPAIIENRQLLCEHDKLAVDVGLGGEYHLNPDDKEDKYVFVSDTEWIKLTEYFTYDKELVVATDLSGQDSTNVEVCQGCVLKRFQDRCYSYCNVKISVRRVDTEPQLSQREAAPAQPQVRGGSLSNKAATATSRSRRRQKDDMQVEVSALDTLKELKFKLVRKLGNGTMASDLHLWVDMRPLTEDLATLRELEITPDSILTLKVDRPVNQSGEEDEEFETNGPPNGGHEQGFRGTLLQDD